MEQKKEEIKKPKKQKREIKLLKYLIATTPEQIEEFRAMQTTCYITDLGQPAKYVHKHFDTSIKAMGYLDGEPVCSGNYIILENGDAYSNMACVYKKFRGCGYIQTLLNWTMIQIVLDPNVKNKKEMFTEARLEMIPYW